MMTISGILTARQLQVVSLMAQGMMSDGIAYELGISTGGVNYHYREIKERLQTRTRNQLCALAVALGDVPAPCSHDNAVSSLSGAERGMLRMLCSGMKVIEVAEAMRVSVSCIMTFRLDEIRDKLGSRNTMQSACMYAAAHPNEVISLNLGTLRRVIDRPELTPDQAEVARMLCGGMMEKNIADAKGTCVSTIKYHVRSMKVKVRAATIFQLCATLAYERVVTVPPKPAGISFSPREVVILDALCSGWRVRELFSGLRLGPTAIKTYWINRFIHKLGVSRTVEAVVIYAAHYWQPIKPFGDCENEA